MTLFVAFNYGGRAEILDAAERYEGGGEEAFRELLYEPEMRDPELVIRTSGEERLVNLRGSPGLLGALLHRRPLADFDRSTLEEALQAYVPPPSLRRSGVGSAVHWTSRPGQAHRTRAGWSGGVPRAGLPRRSGGLAQARSTGRASCRWSSPALTPRWARRSRIPPGAEDAPRGRRGGGSQRREDAQDRPTARSGGVRSAGSPRRPSRASLAVPWVVFAIFVIAAERRGVRRRDDRRRLGASRRVLPDDGLRATFPARRLSRPPPRWSPRSTGDSFQILAGRGRLLPGDAGLRSRGRPFTTSPGRWP